MIEVLLCSFFFFFFFFFFFEPYEQLWNNSQGNWWLPVCVILFSCTIRDIIMHNAQALKFYPSLKLFQSCSLFKVVHAYQNFLEQNSKAPSYRSMRSLRECHVWNQMKDFVILIIIFVLMEESYHGIVVG